MANMDKMAIMAVMALLHMAMNMAGIGVYAKNRENVDQQWKRNWNTSLAAPGALAHRLQRRTARKANEANLDFPNLENGDHFSKVIWAFWLSFAK